MAPYHILIVIISSVIPENLVLLTKSEQSGPKSAHIRPTTTLGFPTRIRIQIEFARPHVSDRIRIISVTQDSSGNIGN